MFSGNCSCKVWFCSSTRPEPSRLTCNVRVQKSRSYCVILPANNNIVYGVIKQLVYLSPPWIGSRSLILISLLFLVNLIFVVFLSICNFLLFFLQSNNSTITKIITATHTRHRIGSGSFHTDIFLNLSQYSIITGSCKSAEFSSILALACVHIESSPAIFWNQSLLWTQPLFSPELLNMSRTASLADFVL